MCNEWCSYSCFSSQRCSDGLHLVLMRTVWALPSVYCYWIVLLSTYPVYGPTLLCTVTLCSLNCALLCTVALLSRFVGQAGCWWIDREFLFGPLMDAMMLPALYRGISGMVFPDLLLDFWRKFDRSLSGPQIPLLPRLIACTSCQLF
jgi:hypothetical protein